MWSILWQWVLASSLMFTLLGGWWFIKRKLELCSVDQTVGLSQCGHCGHTDDCPIASSRGATGEQARSEKP